MLFDLRSRGRRRTVKVIYLFLAVLMGGGLVLFGIGGNTSGGLFDAINGNSGGGGGDSSFQKRAEVAQKRVTASPHDAIALAALARAEYQLAGVGDNYDQNTGTFTDKGKQQLRRADSAWQRYLATSPKKVDSSLANQMVQAYGPSGLNDSAKAVDAQEIVIDNGQDGSGQYANLAVLAYGAGQTRKGDLAAKKALELSENKTQRDQLKQAFDQAKSGQLGQAATPPAG